jgi:hexokinase
MLHLRSISRLVTRRAASLLAVAIHAFWLLRIETLGSSDGSINNVLGQSVAFACNGGIVLKYPNFLKNCQNDVDALCNATRKAAKGDGGMYGKVDLDIADEAAVLGAAVAAVVAQKA